MPATRRCHPIPASTYELSPTDETLQTISPPCVPPLICVSRRNLRIKSIFSSQFRDPWEGRLRRRMKGPNGKKGCHEGEPGEKSRLITAGCLNLDVGTWNLEFWQLSPVHRIPQLSTLFGQSKWIKPTRPQSHLKNLIYAGIHSSSHPSRLAYPLKYPPFLKLILRSDLVTWDVLILTSLILK
jgi:hypothetical protein